MRCTKISKSALFGLCSALTMIVPLVGCDLFGGGLAGLPFGGITSVQLFDQPNFTLALSVESAVADPSQITKVNWVFGDGTGFVEGEPDRATVTHRYNAIGSYDVSVFLFNQDGFQKQINGTITVVANDDGSTPDNDDDNSSGLPGKISSASPIDNADNISVDIKLTWIAGRDTDTHDVYLGTDEDDVEDADNATAGIFRGNQNDTEYDPNGLSADTEYFWRVDEVNDVGTTKGVVRSFTTAETPKAAKNPTPADGSLAGRVDGTLSWVAGANASSHDVYFGKNFSAVDSADDEDDDIFQGNQPGTTFDPDDEDATIDGLLLPDTLYYWRIDEVGPGGTVKGTVWTFRTRDVPPKITSSVPADLSTDVDVTQVLSWTAAPAVESYDVYFGTDAVNVESATKTSPEFSGNQVGKTFDPASLLGDTNYFWRIDTVGPGGTTKGDVLRFTTASPPAEVIGPFVPAHNATSVDIETKLEWNVGGGGQTNTFDVYLSTSSNAVTNGLASALQGNQDVSLTSFQPTNALNANTVYFWRVDAIGPGGKTTGAVRSFTTGSAPGKASAPSPSNNQLGVDLNVTLSWSAGLAATSHDVYFGTDQTQVQNGTKNDAAYKTNIPGTSYVPGELEGNTTYFWRIDARGPGGATKGDVWKFTTSPLRASAPSPANQATNVGLDATLEWTAGQGATSHNVYFGDNLNDVNNATTATVGIFKINQVGTSYDPAPGILLLDGNKDYFWRIDEVTPQGTTKGAVWKFTTGPGQAATPISPISGAVNVDLTPTLTWNAGSGAQQHDVYLGTDQNAVSNATHASAEFQTSRSLGNENFTPGAPLTGFTSYFWRIDEVAPGGTTKGLVWQFKTKPDKATSPVPADFAVNIAVDTTLQWTAASGAASHDVYFGTNLSDVTNSTNTTVLGTVVLQTTPSNTIDPGALQGDTNYYWRVDSIANDGLTRTKGTVWRFKTVKLPDQAASPAPTNLETSVALDATLSWTAGTGATTHDVYFGDDLAAVTNATTATAGIFRINQAGTTYDPTSGSSLLDGNKDYYWRIDEKNTSGTTKGVVWKFSTRPAQATTPISPVTGAVNVDLTPTLTWTAGSGATSHDVYLGTDLNGVTNATHGSVEFQGSRLLGSESFTPVTPLNGFTSYFWRIDEVASGGTTKGVIWQFKTKPGKAISPTPANFATGISIDTLLQWTAATGAVNHEVYIGTSQADVTNSTSTTVLGSTTLFTTPGTTIDPGTLLANTIYYWRVDTVAGDGITRTKGDIWRFTTLQAPAQAGSPSPFNGATDVDINAALNWSAAARATSYNVYFGTTAVPDFQGNQTTTSYTTGTKLPNTTYFWRVDAVNDAGTTTGVLWSFKTKP